MSAKAAMTKEDLRRTVLMLQEELAHTNHEVIALALELEQRVEDLARANTTLRTEIEERRKVEHERAALHAALERAYNDLRDSQERLVQQERLRALGQMASGIAHDVNNVLSPASIYAQTLLERDQTLSREARAYLTVIQRAIENVGGTVARMRMFYRPREPELALIPLDLNDLLQQVADLTRARWSDMPQERGIVIRLITEFAPDLPRIMGAESEIRDALTNLILNAVDAMPDGGTLTLRTRVAEVAAAHGHTNSVPQVCAEICDTGVGMSEEVRRRCLEPFFTTKGEAGTGLGLATVYGMVQRHSAELEIETQAGAGTTMRIVFPAAVLSQTREPASSTRAPRPLRILVVDDDPLLLKALRDALESEGHFVAGADGGQQGIDAFVAAREEGVPFEAVITDLGMPNVDGRTVAAAIKSSAADTPIILLTGWGHRMQREGELPEHVDRVLSKPPRLAELRAALAELAESN